MRIDTGNSTGEFLSTLSLRRATSSKIISSSIIAYFYPRSPCGERQSVGYSAVRLFIFLSTLSLRRATAQDILTALNNIFLSTLSLRRATLRQTFNIERIKYFYPRSPCGERLGAFMRFLYSLFISIHALLAESDSFGMLPRCLLKRISIHALLAESDRSKPTEQTKTFISIHALLAESDQSSAKSTPEEANFYPRSPCGERPGKVKVVEPGLLFLSTLSLRRATVSFA